MIKNYYDENAEAFIKRTINLNLERLYAPFLSHLKPGAKILDAGCGSGRDSLYFKNLGFDVSGFDESDAMVNTATKYTRIQIQKTRFQDILYKKEFDAIWACSSLLHIPLKETNDVLNKLADALVSQGILFVSYKYGSGERHVDLRSFTDMNELKLNLIVSNNKKFSTIKIWKTNAVGSSKDIWLNGLLKKRE